ncbi:hypothetical protein V6N13_071122 [Hibiscus sabdariffa]
MLPEKSKESGGPKFMFNNNNKDGVKIRSEAVGAWISCIYKESWELMAAASSLSVSKKTSQAKCQRLSCWLARVRVLPPTILFFLMSPSFLCIMMKLLE